MPFKDYWIEVFLTPYVHNFVYIEWVRYPIESQFQGKKIRQSKDCLILLMNTTSYVSSFWTLH